MNLSWEWAEGIFIGTSTKAAVIRRLCEDALILTFVVVAFLVLFQSAKDESYEACERARISGPYLVRFYEQNNVLPPLVLTKYKASIPSEC